MFASIVTLVIIALVLGVALGLMANGDYRQKLLFAQKESADLRSALAASRFECVEQRMRYEKRISSRLMALYFFHLRDGETYEEDADGVLCPDVEIARTEAVAAAREMLSEQIALGIPLSDQVFEVCDEDGVMVFGVAFKDILHS